MMNINMLNQRHQFPYLGFMPLVDVEAQNVQFAFQEDALANSIELPEDDMDTANDIDDFASLLASVEDDEAAKDIDALSDLIETLSKSQSKQEMSDLLINDLIPVPSFTDNDLDDLFLDATRNDHQHMEAVEMDDSSDEYDSDEEAASLETNPFPRPICGAGAFLAPIDPRCCIKTPIFKTLDSRIPMISIPKMDVSFSCPRPASLDSPAESTSHTFVVPPASPSSCPSAADSDESDEQAPYVHDASRCWVCKSDKSEKRKTILHRYVEKRYRRNWKRGARYKARSRVASSRVREGGRFVTKCQWFAPSYE